MVRTEVIRKRLNRLDHYLKILHDLKKYSEIDFENNPEIYGSTERFLHLSIEALIDIGNHIISDLNLGEINWYSDIPRILKEKGHIDENQMQLFVKMIGFRNTLIHDYVDIDRRIAFDVLQNHLNDIKMLQEVFARFL